MTENKVSVEQRNALFALMAEGGEASNVDLRERYGAPLYRKDREELQHRKLLGSRKVGQTYHYELLDAGWVQCAKELEIERSHRGSVALYAIVVGLRRYCESGGSLAEVFGRQTGQGGDASSLDEEIRRAYRGIATRPGAYILLADLRRKLSSVSRQDLDAALRRMTASGRVLLAPEEDQKRITKTDREAAIRIGARDKHLVAIELQ
jgi:hypothetical protein